jgi:hypothetical protein
VNLKNAPTRILAVTLSLAMSQIAVPAAQAASHLVDPGQITASLIEKAQSRQSRVALFQQALATSEVQQKARSLGLDAGRLSRAIPHLSDAQLADLAARATRAQDLVAGHRHHGHHYGGDTTLIIVGVALLLAAAIILAVASDDEDDWEVDW